MSKRQLKKYLQDLDKEQLEEQIVDLYERFKPVKVFYDFVFNPREEELMRKSKLKISKEYFPETRRKPKARRSVAQKEIKNFKSKSSYSVLSEFLLPGGNNITINAELNKRFKTKEEALDFLAEA